jgi:hypothetical protein
VETVAPDKEGVIRLLRPAPSLDQTPPRVVAEAFAAAAQACSAAGGSAVDPDRPMTVPDVDGDGIRDWIIPEFYCDMPDGQKPFRPTMTLFASAGDPARPALAASGERLEIDSASTPARVLTVDLNTCSPEGLKPQACRRQRLVWSSEKRRLLSPN